MIMLYILITICYVITIIMVWRTYNKIELVENKLKEIIENQNRINE